MDNITERQKLIAQMSATLVSGLCTTGNNLHAVQADQTYIEEAIDIAAKIVDIITIDNGEGKP